MTITHQVLESSEFNESMAYYDSHLEKDVRFLTQYPVDK